MKRQSIGILLMTAVLAVALVLTACTPKAEAPPVVPAPPPTAPAPPPPTAPPAMEPQTLLFNGSYTYPTTVEGIYIQQFGREVEERTNGLIKFEYAWANSLTMPGEEIDSVVARIADFAMLISGYYPSKLFLTNLFAGAIPFAVNDTTELYELSAPLFDDERLLDPELEALGLKFLWFRANSWQMLSREPVTKLEDLQGMKIAQTGEIPSKMFEAVGAVPLPTTLVDRGPALQTGLLDGSNLLSDLSYSFGLHEFAPYSIEMPIAAGPAVAVFVMNLELFNSLPEDIQYIIELVGRQTSREHNLYAFYERKKAEELMALEGVIFSPPFSREELVRWANMMDDPLPELVERGEEMGLPYKKTALRFLEAMREAGWEPPREWKVE